MTRHVKEAWPLFDDLFTAGDAVQSVIDSFGWTLLQDILGREIATIEATLEERNAPLSQAEYAMAHGRIGGLKAVRRAAEAIVTVAAQRQAEQKARHEGDAESLPEGVRT